MTRSTLRIASGTHEAPFSSVWRISVDKKHGDVYLGWTKTNDATKISLHQSGHWRYAFTNESGILHPESRDRVITRYKRPTEHIPHVTRGPAIIIPFTSAGHRTLFPDDISSDIQWFQAPSPGKMVEFDLYFLGPGADKSNWGAAHVMGSLSLGGGNSLWVIATVRTDLPNKLLEESERHMTNCAKPYKSLNDFAGGSLIWTKRSEDDFQTPIFVDLPQLAYEVNEQGVKSLPTAKGADGRGRTLSAPIQLQYLGTPLKLVAVPNRKEE